MKKGIKNFLVLIILSATLIVVIPGQIDGKDGDSCACYDEEEAARKACAFLAEYKSSTLIRGTCYGPSCKAKVKVTCKDLDEKDEYTKEVTVWGDNCADCNGSGTGGGGGNAGFEDLNGDYGLWHNPNWY